jgi:NitT/TauT family transport system ATP-binding protein
MGSLTRTEKPAAPAGNGPVPSISATDLSFAYNGKRIFENLNFYLDGNPGISSNGNLGQNPLVILGPSGCGKTTLLKLLAGLLRPDAGAFAVFSGETAGGCSFVFQEPRLLPWKTVLDNVRLPAEPLLGKARAGERARHFLRQVSLEEKAAAYPEELSGGQKQRVSFARAFTFPGSVLLMDEPFQSLDIPLRIQLMDLTRSLLEASPRLALVVTHDPREAVYLGRRIMVLGNPPAGLVFDKTLNLESKDRAFGSEAQNRLEAELTGVLSRLCQ